VSSGDAPPNPSPDATCGKGGTDLRATPWLLVLLLAVGVGGCTRPPGAGDSTFDGAVPRAGKDYPALTGDGAWCWVGDPRAVYHEGEHRRTYVGWVNAQGDIRVAAYDHETGEVATETVRKELQRDDHASPALFVLPDGRLMVFYSGHGGRWMICRTTFYPEDIGWWGDEVAVAPFTTDWRGHTYPTPVRPSGEDRPISMFWRGPGFDIVRSESDGGQSWTEAVPFFENGEDRPYTKLAPDDDGAIHFALTDGNPGDIESNSIYYLRLAGGELTRADGTPVAGIDELPLRPSDCEIIFDSVREGLSAWIWDIAVDADGRPVIVYVVFAAEDDHRYRYARWDGTSWNDHEITPAGGWFPTVRRGSQRFTTHYSGGLALDHSRPSVVYLSREIGGVFEIERWVTSDRGATWTSRAITANSEKNNVRPFVPRGGAPDGPRVIWMHGDYVDWKDYATSLRMMID
jgi:hypothetical protein